MCIKHGSALFLSLAIAVLYGYGHLLSHEDFDAFDVSARLLSADDECHALGSSSNDQCTLHALQHRGYHRSTMFTDPQASDPEDCHDALQGEECWNEIQWARNQGMIEHADWYAGLTSSSSAASFQAVVHESSPGKCPRPCSSDVHKPANAAQASPASEPEPIHEPAPVSGHEPSQQTPMAPLFGDNCHDAAASEACWDEIQWARSQGVREHPEWYPGLSMSASAAAFQAVVHQRSPDKCPRPCSSAVRNPAPASHPVSPPAPAPSRTPAEHGREPAKGVIAEKGKWCASSPTLNLWSPAPGGVPMQVKVLSFNLFWWNLYGLRAGNGDSAGRLIASAGHNQKFDFMGFQECEDAERVLAGQGLLKHYEVIQGEHACCIAYSKRWKLLEKGSHDVAEDMETKYYGTRGAQWIRVQSTWDKRTALFINHHGPLSVNSGGICGGRATAHNLLSLMAKHGSPGDMIFLVGDFNANAASLTIQGLWPHLVHVYNSDSWGGIDNIFSNIQADSIISTKNLGSGGSDHTAIEAVFAVGDQPWRKLAHAAESGASSAAKDLVLFPPTTTWEKFWCGRIEQDIEYQFAPSGWSTVTGAHDPEACCRECQNNSLCKAWVWMRAGGQCQLHGARPQQMLPRPAGAGVVSGLTATEATALSTEASVSALWKV